MSGKRVRNSSELVLLVVLCSRRRRRTDWRMFFPDCKARLSFFWLSLEMTPEQVAAYMHVRDAPPTEDNLLRLLERVRQLGGLPCCSEVQKAAEGTSERATSASQTH